MERNVSTSSRYTLRDWISYFRNGIERYNRSPIVHQVVSMLCQNNDPYRIIDQLCEIIDKQQKDLEEAIKRSPSPSHIITPDISKEGEK